MRIETIVEKIIAAIEWIITFFLFVIFGLTAVLVILRYVFNSSILGGSELVTFLFIYTTALGSAIAIPKNRHIRISYFVDHLSGMVRVIAEVFVYFLVALINVVMLLYSLDWIAKVGSDLSQSLGIPLGLVKVSVPIGCSLAVIFSLYAAYCVIKKGAPLEEENFV